MNNSKIKVVVTGGCGFIGSHLVDLLINSNYEVVVIDDKSSISNEIFYVNKSAKYYTYSITDENIPHEEIFKDAVYVFHLAAESRIGPSIDNPIKAASTNIIGTTMMLQYSRLYNIKKFIYSSTSSVYGNTENLPTTINESINCLNPYSATKYAGEKMVEMYYRMFEVNSVILRYFNVFGDRSPVGGPYAPVVGIFLKQQHDNKPLTVVGDGNQRRDFIYVSDVVRANLLAAISDVDYGLFNVGSGTNISINEIAELISDNVVYLPPRIGEAKDTLADITLSSAISFTPTITINDYIKSNN